MPQASVPVSNPLRSLFPRERERKRIRQAINAGCAIRYGLIYRTMGAQLEPVRPERDEADHVEDYDDYMTGGSASAGYLSYGG